MLKYYCTWPESWILGLTIRQWRICFRDSKKQGKDGKEHLILFFLWNWSTYSIACDLERKKSLNSERIEKHLRWVTWVDQIRVPYWNLIRKLAIRIAKRLICSISRRIWISRAFLDRKKQEQENSNYPRNRVNQSYISYVWKLVITVPKLMFTSDKKFWNKLWWWL